MKNATKQIIIILLLIALPLQAKAAMRSSSYIIYENVMHSFDGPVISGVAHSVSGNSVTITWSTNVVSDAFVIYDTDSGFGSSMEQGNSSKINTTQSVLVSGLNYSTTYYYNVRSMRINGGLTTDTTLRSFATGADPNVSTSDPTPDPSSGGGGVLIIDKTDKFAPEISNIQVNKNIEDREVEITWMTNENSTSFIEYGYDDNYGNIAGQWDEIMEHKVVIDNIKEGHEYHFRAVSSDDWGNVGYGEDGTFVIGEKKTEEEIQEEIAEEEDKEGVAERARRKALEFLKRLFPEMALNDIKDGGLDDFTNFEDLENFIPMPILSGEPRVEIGATNATVFWKTDSDSTSQVAVASEARYNQNANEPYAQIVGDVENLIKDHEVKIVNLTPDTTYHFQLRSKGRIGPMAHSRDFTFKTQIEELTISNYFTQIIDNQTVIFKWITNKNADSEIKFAPYHDDKIAFQEAKVIKNNEQGLIHEIKVEEFQAGIFYEIEIASTDVEGNRAIEVIKHFSTSEEDVPPEITHIKADSTIFIDRSDKIQTVISWLTNEPATSRVYFEEGVHGGVRELALKTELKSSYSKEHVMVIPKFKPGLVYTFKVESMDSGGNISTSKAHTFMTAKKRESIIQIIMRILEDTFGWIKNIK